jgi:hypothetical protein
MWPHRSLLGALGAGLVGMAAGYAGAQSMSGLGAQSGQSAAQTFVTSQGPALNATATAGDTSVVAGASANTSSYQGLAANPGGLANAGQAARSTDPTAGLVGTSYNNQASTTVSSSDAWYQSSLSGTAAQSTALSTSGTPQQTCQTTQTQTQVTSNAGIYTCDSTEQVTDSNSTCVQNLVVSTATTDLYACQNTYNQTTKQWVTSPACAALGAAAQCSSTGTACTAPANPYFQATQCTAGTEWTGTPQTCSETRNVVIGTDYNYACANPYNPATKTWTTSPACAALASNAACSQQTQTCGLATPPISKSCQQGQLGSLVSQTCDPVLQVTVGTNYIYNGYKNWNGSAYVPTAQETALINASGGGTCQLQATNCTANYAAQTYSCQTGYAVQSTQTTCQVPAGPFYANGVQYAAGTGSGMPLVVGATWLYSCYAMPATGTGVAETCSEFSAAAGCTKTGQTTVLVGRPYAANNSYPANTRLSVTQYSYSCTAAVTAANPYFAFALRAGPGAGAAGAQAYFDQCAPSYSSNCTFVSRSCKDTGGATVSANGTGLYGSGCLQTDVTYSCSATVNAAGCSPPAGYSQTASSCAAKDANGNCTETSQTWTLPGGCASYQDQWLCKADVPAADPYVQIQQYVASATWSNACQALAANGACSLTSSQVTQGQSTQVISGLAVTEPAWAEHNTYTCGTTTPVDTCTGAVTGCSQTAATCAQTGPTGTCQLWTYTYACPNNDGSGGCEQNNYTYQCTADVAAADPFVSTSPYLISANWTTQCQALSQNGACDLTTDQTDPTSTKIFSGLSVTEPGWNKTDTYTCWASQPIDGCSGNVTGCNQTGKTCAGNDRTGACSVWTYTYSCPANDGSGNCSVKTSTYTCTGFTPAAADVSPADPALSSSTVVTGTQWSPACAQASQSSCQSTGTTCNQGPSIQTINGVAVTEPCWQQTTSYSCEATAAESSDCNPPAGCTHTADTCLDDPPAASGCVSMEHDYSCQTTTTQTTTSSTCSTQLCMGSQCFSVSGSNDSGSLAKAYTALSIGHAAGQSYSNPASNLQIMPGAHYACHKALTGFSNCCKDAGWGQSLGVAQCSEAEKTLMQMQQAGECHHVGDYCSNKSLFGICLQRTMSYCCYQGSLARIIAEAGRPQVGKVWGNPKNPDCSGFTVAQFQSLNLANVDFSSFYNQALGGLNVPSASSATSSIQATLQQMQSGNTLSTLSSSGP